MTPPTGQGARIFLADDHPAVLEGLALLLAQEHHLVCGEATNQAEVLERLDASAPDIALVDLALCGESGLDIIPLMQDRGIPVLVYSMHEDQVTLKRALKCGALGFVTKREPSAVLLEGVRKVLAGESYLSPRVAACFGAETADSLGQGGPLSEREQQILDLLARGEANADIAATLGVSGRTVETYCSRILIKLSLDGMKALRKYAIQLAQTS
jgi:DNA-binding NarL/FixJ family response regulator